MGETVTVDDTNVSPAELREALRLSETVTLSEGALQPDGTVVLDLLRPCTGRGRGRHLYKAEMLRENAHKLSGWKMFVDHESDEARRKAGGLPRSIRDLGGRIIESFWNPDVPADRATGFGQGAVQGKVRPTRFVRELIEDDPELVECSINSNATGVKPGVDEGGRRVWIVEGIQDRGSVDWVTEAGAGGKVASLMESVYNDQHAEEDAVLESMSDQEVRQYIERERPDLLEAMDGGNDEDDEEFQNLVKKFTDNGMPLPAAKKAARRALSRRKTKAKGLTESDHDEGDAEVEITAEALREALDTDEGRDVLLGLIREQAQDDLRSLVEAALDEERDLIRREAQAQAERQNDLRDMRDLAHERIAAAKLPDKFADRAKSRFALVEGVPTDDLDQIDDVDDDGEVSKSASDKLTEAVDAVVAEQRDLVGSLRPAQVRGQGPSVSTEGETDSEGKTSEPKPYAVPARTAALLQEAGFDDPDEVYAPSQ
jgi:hypothetical protein